MQKHATQLHLRVSPKEKERTKQLAQSNNMTVSDLVRVLIQLPTEAIDNSPARLVVIDAKTHARLQREMRRWGYHYNQSVHALNTIAYYLRRDKIDDADMLEALNDVESRIKLLDGVVGVMRRDIETITDSMVAWR